MTKPNLTDGVGECHELVVGGLRVMLGDGVRVGQADDIPILRHRQRLGVLGAQVVGPRLMGCRERPHHRRRFGVDVGERRDGEGIA